jgi:hypothetical protein
LYNPERLTGPAERQYIEDLLQRNITGQLRAGARPQVGGNQIILPGQQGPLPLAEYGGEQLMRGQSSLRRLGHRLGRNPDQLKQDTGAVFRDIADEVYNLMGRQDPATGALLQELRGPYSAHKTVSEAVRRAPAQGQFTMRSLANLAGRTGNEDLQTFARVGADLLPESVPDSGSASRIMWGLAGLAAPKVAVPAAAAGMGFGTKTGQKALQGQLGWQQRLADVLKEME